MWKWSHLKSWSLIGTKLGLLIQYRNLHMFMRSKVTKVKDHQRSSCKMSSKCKIHLIWKVEVRLEPNLVNWYDIGTFTCSWGQRSQMKIKGCVKYKIAWKCYIWLICILEGQLEPCDPNKCEIKVMCNFASSTNQPGTVLGPQSIFV